MQEADGNNCSKSKVKVSILPSRTCLPYLPYAHTWWSPTELMESNRIPQIAPAAASSQAPTRAGGGDDPYGLVEIYKPPGPALAT